MSLPADASPEKTPAPESLPPVEPPSGGFIVQLFVVPAVIVAVIALLYGLFFWWGQVRSDDAEKYIQALERNNQARWQAAVSLADALRDPRNVELRRNAAVAHRLAEVLDADLASGSGDMQDLKLRTYLCHALGEFEVADGVPVLLKAAKSDKTEDDKYVRYAALKGLAVFAAQPAKVVDPVRPPILALMLEASHDPEPIVRSTAAFGLAALGGEKAGQRLAQLTSDANVNVRYNAALMLASHGDLASLDVLEEMLDPKSKAALEIEDDDAPTRENKRIAILVNALRAARKLAERYPDTDFKQLRTLVDALKAPDNPKPVRLEALLVAKELDAHRVPATSAK